MTDRNGIFRTRSCKNWEECLSEAGVRRFWSGRTRNYVAGSQLQSFGSQPIGSVACFNHQRYEYDVPRARQYNSMCFKHCFHIQSSRGGVLEGEWLWLLIIHTYGNSMWLLCHSLWWRSDSLWLLPISSPKHTIPLPYHTIPYNTWPKGSTKHTIPVRNQNIHYKITANWKAEAHHVIRGYPQYPMYTRFWSANMIQKTIEKEAKPA